MFTYGVLDSGPRLRSLLSLLAALLCASEFCWTLSAADAVLPSPSASSPFSVVPSGSAFRFSDFLVAPLRVHLLSARDAPDWDTTLTATDVDRILRKINRIWGQAGLHFYLESLVREEAKNQDLHEEFTAGRNLKLLLRLRPESSRTNGLFHIYYIKKMHVNGVFLGEAMFVKDQASLRAVPGGIDEPIPRVSSHELGHALSLPHRQAVTNLMASGTTGTALNSEEIRRVRNAARHLDWIEPAPEILKRADALFDREETTAARALYRRLAGLPFESPPLIQARRRANAEP
jgi:hypothetical protein